MQVFLAGLQDAEELSARPPGAALTSTVNGPFAVAFARQSTTSVPIKRSKA